MLFRSALSCDAATLLEVEERDCSISFAFFTFLVNCSKRTFNLDKEDMELSCWDTWRSIANCLACIKFIFSCVEFNLSTDDLKLLALSDNSSKVFGLDLDALAMFTTRLE